MDADRARVLIVDDDTASRRGGQGQNRLVGPFALAVTAVLMMVAALAAQRTGKQATPEKINWSEKEEVTVIRAGHFTS